MAEQKPDVARSKAAKQSRNDGNMRMTADDRPQRKERSRLISLSFILSTGLICLSLAAVSLDRNFDVSAATYRGPAGAPPTGNIPMTIWNRRASDNYQADAKIEIDGDALIGGGVTAGYYRDASTSQTHILNLGADLGGQNVIYGVADYYKMNAGDFLLKLETYDATTDKYTERFHVGKDGELKNEGCFGATFVGFTAAKYKGNAAVDYYGADNKCRTDIIGSHVCRVEEILESIKCAAGNPAAPIRNAALVNGKNAWVNGGPPGYTSFSDDCLGWSYAAASPAHYGRMWMFDSVTGGKGTMSPCSVGAGLNYACCK